MKKIEITLESCKNCPYIKYCGEYYDELHCKHPDGKGIPNWGVIAIVYPYQTFEWPEIPDWCPLPEADTVKPHRDPFSHIKVWKGSSGDIIVTKGQDWGMKEIITLSERDTEIFIEALKNPRDPNEALKKAAKDYAINVEEEVID